MVDERGHDAHLQHFIKVCCVSVLCVLCVCVVSTCVCLCLCCMLMTPCLALIALQEAALLNRLHHPNIVAVHGLVASEPPYCLVLEEAVHG